MKRSLKGLAGLHVVSLANDTAILQVALGKVDELPLLHSKSPDIPARRCNDSLYQPKPAAEVDAIRRRQRLAVLVEYRNGLASVVGEPSMVIGVDCSTERAALHSAASKAGGDWRHRLAIGSELCGGALPQRIVPLPADGKVVTDPEVPLTVKHAFAARTVASTVELKRQHPCTGRVVEIGHEGHRAKVLAVRNWIKLVKQGEESFGFIPGVKSDRLERIQRVGWRAAARRRSCREETIACIRLHQRDAARQQVGKRGEVGHCWCLTAIQWSLDRISPASSWKIDEVREVAGGDAQAQGVATQRVAVQK